MGIIVEPGDPFDQQARALLEASHALMQELFSPEENFYLPLDALAGEDVRFFVAREYDTTLGCGALALRDTYGEVKSMFTAPFARGNGVGGRVLSRLELEARAVGLSEMRLETGYLLEAAHMLYRKNGYVECDRFGDYPDSPASLFMKKSLDA